MVIRKETNQQRKLEGATSDFKSRDDLINEIDKYYNKPGYIGDLSQNYKGPNMEWYKFVEKEIKKITGKFVDTLPDDDPDEGFYSNFSTSELTEVLDDINNVIDNLTEDSKVTVELTTRELNLIKAAMEMWSSTSFSKSREESSIARDILDKLRTNLFESLQTSNESPIDTSNWKPRFKGMDVFTSDKNPGYQIKKSYNGSGEEVWEVVQFERTGAEGKRVFVGSSFEAAVDFVETGKRPRKPKSLR